MFQALGRNTTTPNLRYKTELKEIEFEGIDPITNYLGRLSMNFPLAEVLYFLYLAVLLIYPSLHS